MAYTITGSNVTVRPISQTQVQKVLEIAVTTIPEGIEFLYDFPYESWINPAQGTAALEAVVGPVVADVQAISANGNVSAAYFVQDTAPNGLLVGYIEAVVSVQPKDVQAGTFLTEAVDIPVEILGNPEFRAFTWQAMIDAAVARLQSLP